MFSHRSGFGAPLPDEAVRMDETAERRSGERVSGPRISPNVSTGLREHVERSPLAIAVVDGVHYAVRYANPAFRRLAGGEHLVLRRPAADAVQQSVSEHVSALLHRVHESGRPESDVEIERAGADGSDAEPISWSVTIWAVPDRRRSFRDLVLQIRDITAEVRERRYQAAMAAQLREINQRLLLASFREEELREQAQAASAAKSVFLATMSHELRTPLTAIIGYEDLLATAITGPVTDAQQEQLARIKAAASHLLELIDEVLTLSRAEANREEAGFHPIVLSKLIEAVTTLVVPLVAEKGLTLTVGLPDKPIAFRSDELKLRQILVSLLGNAVKFSDRGMVSLLVRAEGGEVLFEVRDGGIGIEAEHLERIFDPFWQVHQTSNRITGGSGLGLCVSRRLARLLGGDVAVASVAGEGSTFTLRLPVDRPETTD